MTAKIWTKDKIMREARKYKTKKEFREALPSAYVVASRNGYLTEITVNMARKKNPSELTKKRCSEIAKQYETRGDFKKYDNSAYVTAHREGWLDDICKHMINGRVRRFAKK